MRIILIHVSLILCSFNLLCSGQEAKSFTPSADGINVLFNEGTLSLSNISDNAIRVRFFSGIHPKDTELIFINAPLKTQFKVSETTDALQVKGKGISVTLDKKTGVLSFSDNLGNIFLKEKNGARQLIPGTVRGEPCFLAEQSFESPVDEYLFGLGQFQDGHYNIKGVTRRLIQVNSQISIPFIYSNKGYGLLWHQYGLTDYNPADNQIILHRQEPVKSASGQSADVTTTAGTQRMSQSQSIYTGTFVAPSDGEYSIFLDLGDMGNRHFVAIDDIPCIDQSNMWLPPAAGALVYLTAGEHKVQVLCRSTNTPSLFWNKKENQTTFRSPNALMIDYVVFSGQADEVIGSYRKLSGAPPLFPLWAYGFWQCRERYISGTNLVETVKEFRNRKIPMDVIVQDWQYWGNRGWGVPQFDEINYPNPAGFIKEIHDLNAHFNISIWSNPDKNSDIGKEFVSKKRFIGESKWLDYFNPETRKEYWNTLKINMFDNGVDSWWMDAVEPENDALKGERTFAGAGEFYRLTYPLMVSQAVYEGQRETSSDKRVCILTRSAFSGQQRYGIINWSGDIGGNWEVFRNQIVAGLNFTITGLPYWTTDIGGFFRPGRSQYTDEKFHELLTRWYQWGTFNPIFRMHAYQTETEPWKYGQTVENNMRKMLDLRYRLLPYIYSEAWQVTRNGSTMMRPLVMDFNGDASAVKQPYEYMFGKAILVAPIIQPGATQREVYLPESNEWYDFWTGKRLNGGQIVKAEAPLDRIPLFIRAGSIIPMGPVVQYSGEKNDEAVEIRIYEGANGTFTLYEDENDNYNYEKGMYSTIDISWNDSGKILKFSAREGSFPGMLSERKFNIVNVARNKVSGIYTEISQTKVMIYKGKKLVVKLD